MTICEGVKGLHTTDSIDILMYAGPRHLNDDPCPNGENPNYHLANSYRPGLNRMEPTYLAESEGEFKERLADQPGVAVIDPCFIEGDALDYFKQLRLTAPATLIVAFINSTNPDITHVTLGRNNTLLPVADLEKEVDLVFTDGQSSPADLYHAIQERITI